MLCRGPRRAGELARHPDLGVGVHLNLTDGAPIANQLHAYLTGSGHQAYLDEAKETDDEPAILPGSDVQVEIDEALKGANLLLLIDTPDAPASRWIKIWSSLLTRPML